MTENTFTPTGWTENVVSGPEDGPRFAHAHATFDYAGLIEGAGTCEYLLFYAGAGYDGGGTTSPGLERIEGSVAGRKGSFVIRHDVGFDAQGISGTFTVVPGSGTGELSGLAGTGTVAGAMTEPAMAYTFAPTFPEA